MNLRLLLIFIFTQTFQMYGQDQEIYGNPYIQNFTREDFKLDPKIWSITENADGELFFATPEGLVTFDGNNWGNYTTKADPNILCVFNSEDNTLYSSGYGNFGYWKRDLYGNLVYNPLFEKYDELNQGFWRINENDENLYFQSSISIYVFSKKNKEIKIIPTLSEFTFMFKSKNKVFVNDRKEGLFEINNNKLQKIAGSDIVDDVIIGASYNSNSIKLFTSNNGVFDLKNGKLSSVEWKVNDELKSNSIFTVTEFNNGDLYVGTIRNGVYILSSDGNVKFHANKEKGILNNTVLSLYKDSKENLWLGIDGGISHIEINSSIRYILDVHEDFGSVYTSILKDSILYLGTNQGLFAKNILQKNRPSQLVDGSQGQVWLIQDIDGEIFVGHHKGAFLLQDGKLKPLYEGSGTWIFRKNPTNKNILYSGNYLGVRIFQKQKGNWVFVKQLDGFKESSRFMEFDKFNQLWIAHPTHGYHRINFSENGIEVLDKEFYANESPNASKISKLSLIDGDVIFYDSSGYFSYNPIEDKFVKSQYTSELLKGISNITSLKQYGDVFWYTTSNSIGYVKREGNKFKRVQEKFSNIGGNNKGDFTHISKLSDKTYGVNIDSGLAIYKEKPEDKEALKAPKLRLIQFLSSKDTITGVLDKEKRAYVPFRNNFAHFLFYAPNLKVGSTFKTEYFLEGISESWTKSSVNMVADFPALPPGDYLLKVRLLSDDGIKSGVLTYKFSIESPWYIKPYFLILYLIIILLLFFIVRYYYSRKVLREQVELRKKEEEKIIRQKEKLELKNLESEKELLVLKEENYRIELEKKNNELAASTMNNIRKNDLLNELKGDLIRYSKQKEEHSKKEDIKKILKKINLEMRNNEDWLTFELHFNNAHGNFFNRLREEYPSLTSNDLKLCAYLKLNLSSKEIASLMNISTRSVEMSRYRLRKKINLKKDESLSKFIGLY